MWLYPSLLTSFTLRYTGERLEAHCITQINFLQLFTQTDPSLYIVHCNNEKTVWEIESTSDLICGEFYLLGTGESMVKAGHIGHDGFLIRFRGVDDVWGQKET